MLTVLFSYSLAKRKGDPQSFRIHRVVHRWAYERLSSLEQRQKAEHAFIAISAACLWGNTRTAETWMFERRIMPHIDACVSHNQDYCTENVDSVAVMTAMKRAGRIYRQHDRFQDAIRLYERTLTGHTKVLGPDHTHTLTTVNNLAELYRIQNRYLEAEKLYQRALAGREKALGPDHTHTLTTVHDLGTLYKIQNKYPEAERLYKRALAGYEKVLGPDHTHTLTIVNNLADLYRIQNRY